MAGLNEPIITASFVGSFKQVWYVTAVVIAGDSLDRRLGAERANNMMRDQNKKREYERTRISRKQR